MPRRKKQRTAGDVFVVLDVDPEQPGHPSLTMSWSDLQALGSDYFDTLLQGSTSAEAYTKITLKCSGLATRGWKAWSAMFAFMRSTSPETLAEHTTLRQSADLLMLLSYYFSPNHPLVERVTKFLRKSILAMIPHESAVALGAEGLAQMERISQYPELHTLLKFQPDATRFLVLPQNEEHLQKYLDLGAQLRALGHTNLWVEWSLRVLETADVGQRALLAEPCDRVRARVQEWLGGFDLVALVASFPYALIAGGSVVTAHLEIAHVRSDSDVDVWVYRQHRDTVLRLVEAIGRACAGTVFVVQDAIVSAVCPAWQCPVQIILVDYCTPWGVPNKFDLDYVKAYADGHHLFIAPECKVAWDSRRVTRLSAPYAKAHRLDKAVAKGFEVCLPDEVKIHEDRGRNKRWRYFHPLLNNPPEHTRTVLRAMFPRATVTSHPSEVAAAYTGRPLHSDIPQHVYVENPKTALELCERLPSPLLGPKENIGSAAHPIHAQKLRHAIGFTVNALRCFYRNQGGKRDLLSVFLDLKHNKEHRELAQMLNHLDEKLKVECKSSRLYRGAVSPNRYTHPENKIIRVLCYDKNTRWMNHYGEKISSPDDGTIPAVRVKARVIYVNWMGDAPVACVAADEVRVYPNHFSASLLAHPKLLMYTSTD